MGTDANFIKDVKNAVMLGDWDLARQSDVTVTELGAVQNGDKQLHPQDRSKLVDFCIRKGICPDCFAEHIRQGGCMICHCGWSRC